MPFVTPCRFACCRAQAGQRRRRGRGPGRHVGGGAAPGQEAQVGGGRRAAGGGHGAAAGGGAERGGGGPRLALQGRAGRGAGAQRGHQGRRPGQGGPPRRLPRPPPAGGRERERSVGSRLGVLASGRRGAVPAPRGAMPVDRVCLRRQLPSHLPQVLRPFLTAEVAATIRTQAAEARAEGLPPAPPPVEVQPGVWGGAGREACRPCCGHAWAHTCLATHRAASAKASRPPFRIQLHTCSADPPTPAPVACLAATLREYQLEGLRWLVQMWDAGMNAILAGVRGWAGEEREACFDNQQPALCSVRVDATPGAAVCLLQQSTPHLPRACRRDGAGQDAADHLAAVLSQV